MKSGPCHPPRPTHTRHTGVLRTDRRAHSMPVTRGQASQRPHGKHDRSADSQQSTSFVMALCKSTAQTEPSPVLAAGADPDRRQNSDSHSGNECGSYGSEGIFDKNLMYEGFMKESCLWERNVPSSIPVFTCPIHSIPPPGALSMQSCKNGAASACPNLTH